MESEALRNYLELDSQWDQLKERGLENTPEEESLLCLMDQAWYLLTEEEMISFKRRLYEDTADGR